MSNLDRRYVRAALRSFSRAGYFGTTVADIAVEARVTQPRVSQVFGDKRVAYGMARGEALDLLTHYIDEFAPSSERGFDPVAVEGAVRELRQDRPEVLSFLLHDVVTGPSVPSHPGYDRSTLVTLVTLLEARGAVVEEIKSCLATFFMVQISASLEIEDDVATGLRAV